MKLKKESEEAVEAFIAITKTEPRRIFVCPLQSSDDEKIEPFEIKNYNNDKKKYLIEGGQIQIQLIE